ncbi:MAG: MFS transporter [Candidatus Methanomethylophilaceae archaeon]|nr:MFS transporter [Candidatus Methanomethylophilaceae archaeon]
MDINVERSWILYDVANSAFVLLAASLLPIYFNDLAAAEGLSDTQYLSYWSIGTALATLIMLVVGPIIGSYSDRKGWRKPIFVAVVLTGALSCLALGIPKWWVAFLLIFVVAKIALNASLVVSDSMLNDITTPDRMDEISSRCYAAGYIGSCIPFIACLVVVVMSDFMESGPGYFSFPTAISISLMITAVWWVVMSLPLFRNYEQKYYNEAEMETLKEKLTYFLESVKEISKNKAMALFLIAFFFYIDGVNTIIEVSVAYGEALNLDSVGLLGALLVTQVVAFPSTLLMSKLSYRIGTHRAIYICIAGYIAVSVFAIFLSTTTQFFIMAIIVGFFQGAIQALSRAYFGRMVPKEKTGEYFGIMDIFGKGATIIGTAAIAVFTSIFDNIRMVAPILLIMFVIGFLFFRQSTKVQIYDSEFETDA